MAEQECLELSVKLVGQETVTTIEVKSI